MSEIATTDPNVPDPSDQIAQITQTLKPGPTDGPIDGGRAPFRPALVRIFPVLVDQPPVVCSMRRKCRLGRDPSLDLVIDDGSVSRRHAVLSTSARGLRVFDEGSTGGTFVDGQRVGKAGVWADFGAVLRFGATLWLAVRDGEAYRAAPRRLAASFLGLPRDVIAGPTLSRVWDQTIRIATLAAPVLVLGESGSGKEAIARLLHATRAAKSPFVGLNVAAIPPTLFESVLFGHEKGAFTGAAAAHPGAFQEACGGVLFLDEVADLGLDLQAKLLRAIDLNQIRPIGARADVNVDVRLVSATSRDLAADCAAGHFRKDLYYRLAGLIVSVPPLRERRDDVLVLAQSILADEAPQLFLGAPAAEALALGQWDGNVRNLRYALSHAIGQAVAAECREIGVKHLPKERAPASPQGPLTKDQVRSAMADAKGVATRAAAALDVSRATFYRVCARLGIETDSLR
jgi:transcriptional regulator of acetoin/glycerol metabolism